MNMKIRTIIAVALAAAFLASPAMAAQADNKDGKGKVKLKDENKRLKMELDSLRAELYRYKADLRYSDSLATAMVELYGQDEGHDGVGLSPEDYTAEVSDSLLNIWYAHRMASDDTEEFDMDSVRFESNVPDEVYIERLKKMNSSSACRTTTS